MLRIGWAQRGITPNGPAMLQGQMHVRVARSTLDPLYVTAMAIEGGSPCDEAVILSFDIAMVDLALLDAIRRKVTPRLPGFDPDKLIGAATHTHTSLVYIDEYYTHPGGDVMPTAQVWDFLVQQASDAVVEARQALAPTKVGRAYGHAVVAHNRRAFYASGDAVMYGQTARPDFRWVEGFEDHSLDVLFVWDAAGKLAGAVINIPCPSQVDEHLTQYSADFWHEIRVDLKKRFGERFWVLPMCGPAGDQSPHFIVYAKQEEEMRKRRGVSERQEIALRVGDAVSRALACTHPAEGELAFRHSIKRVKLTPRQVNKRERDWAETEVARVRGKMDMSSWWPVYLQRVVDTYDGKFRPSAVPVELHFLRIGDAVIATNPFELYQDYGLQIKARSPAGQTILSQLTNGTGFYLPSKRAVEGGGYGAMPAVCKVGPEGGQELVEHTITGITELFAAEV